MYCLYKIRAFWTDFGSLGLAALKSKWCAPSGIMTAIKDFDRFFMTPPLDQGSNNPLLKRRVKLCFRWIWIRVPENDVAGTVDVFAAVCFCNQVWIRLHFVIVKTFFADFLEIPVRFLEHVFFTIGTNWHHHFRTWLEKCRQWWVGKRECDKDSGNGRWAACWQSFVCLWWKRFAKAREELGNF